MKLNGNYVLRQVADTWVVFPIGEATVDLNGMLRLNESGAMLWKRLEQNCDADDLVDALIKEYAVSREDAARDVNEFVSKLAEIGCLEV